MRTRAVLGVLVRYSSILVHLLVHVLVAYSLLYSFAYSCVLVRTRAYSCVLVRTRAYSCVLVRTRAYSCVLVGYSWNTRARTRCVLVTCSWVLVCVLVLYSCHTRGCSSTTNFISKSLINSYPGATSSYTSARQGRCRRARRTCG